MIRVLCVILGYVFGLFQTGYIIGKCKEIDVRQYGSKNAGTTNVLRTLGLKYALIVFVGDALKCIIAVVVCKLLLVNEYADIIHLLQLYTCFGVILGHNFPIYMSFRGGKGIAATSGFIISYCFQVDIGWQLLILGLLTFFITFFISHYVSLGSLLIYVFLMAEVIIIGERGYFDFPENINRACLIEYYGILFIMLCIAFIRHRENIKRLIAGNERKTYLFSKPEIDTRKEKFKDMEA